MISIQYHSTDVVLRKSVEEFISEWLNDSPSLLVQTSGSTGPPKLIELKKEYMRNSARMTGEFLHLQSGDTALLCLSPSTIAGKMMIVRALELNLQLIVVDVQSNPLKNLTEAIDFAALIPLQVQESLKYQASALKSIGKLIIGGAVLHEKLVRQLKGFPNPVWQTFGMTE